MGFLDGFKQNMVSTLSQNLGVWYVVLYNLIGVIAILLMVITYQQKKRSKVIFIYVFATIGWTSYFFLQGEFTACALNFLSILRSIIFLQREKHAWANSKFWLFFFLAIMTTATALTFSTWKDIFPLCGMTLSTIAFFVLNVKLLKLLNACNSCCWLTNNLLKGTYMGAISDTLAITSIIISLIRTKKEEKQLNKANEE